MNETLKIALIKGHIKQIELAYGVSMHPSRVSGIVNGWICPRQEEKEKISQYLKMTVEELFPIDKRKNVVVDQERISAK